MYKQLVFAVMLTSAVWAQDKSAMPLEAAGCGPNSVKFAVKRDAHLHPTASPESGKALVYVFGNSELDNAGFQIGGLITRVGVDGTWAGAYEHKSYAYFAVDPGEHRLCTSQQSVLKSRTENASAITFVAEAGKVYYFQTQPDAIAVSQSVASRVPSGKVELAAVDPAQAELMIAKWAYSTSQPKK